MGTLTVGGISFRDDPQALGCLLFSLIGVSDRNERRVQTQDIFHAARDLGYRGSVSAIIRLLNAQGFVTSDIGGYYLITEKNRAAIRQFAIEYEHLFAPLRLTERENWFLFENIGNGGSDVDQTKLRITRLLIALQEEFHVLDSLKYKNQRQIALLVSEHLIGNDRALWLSDVTDKTLKCAEGYKDGNFTEFVREVVKASVVHNSLDSLVERLSEIEGELRGLARDEENIDLLRQVRVFFQRFITILLKVEEKLK